TTTIKKTTLFKRPMPISSKKANIIQKMNIPNHKHLKSMSVLEADMTDISMEEDLSDMEDSRTNSQEYPETRSITNLKHIDEMEEEKKKREK
ncbi:2374_t:CDS:1, partial [Acaulospora morrowiae]